MEGLKPPSELSFDGNVGENWRKWRRSFENYLLAVNLVTAPVVGGQQEPAGNAAIRRRQLAVLLHTAGEEAYEIYSQFEYDNAGEENNYEIVMQKFQDYCNPRRNVLYEWFVFWNLKQADNESIDGFIKRLKTQASVCEFGDLKERMLLFRVVFGISDTKLKERLLRDEGMTLARATSDIRATEMTKSQLLAMADGDRTIAAVSGDQSTSVAAVSKSAATASSGIPVIHQCKYCGYDHPKGKCPAYGKSCRKCSKKNHFASKCNGRSEKGVNEVQMEDKQMDALYIGVVQCDAIMSQCWQQDVLVGPLQRTISFKLDTGAEANILPKHAANELNCAIVPTKARLMGYGQHHIPSIGKTELLLHHGSMRKSFEFEVVDSSSPPILGLSAVSELNLVRRVESVDLEGRNSSILDEFPQVFQGIGCVEGEHSIKVDPVVTPVIHAARKVPLALMDGVKAELESMEANQIITKVDCPTAWVNSMVVVEKTNGDLRICLDPKDLNKAVMREHHRIPTIQDIALKFQGMTCFSILDMRHGYWHVPLSLESSLLTRFNTPFGRYRFIRLPFGLKSAAEVFEKRVEQLFGDLPGVAMYFDDLVVAGKNREDHDMNLRSLLARADQVNVKFNKKKIQLAKTQVVFLGHVVSCEGLKPDPSKIKSISDMPPPTDKAGVQRLLGTVNYLGSYIPNLATITQPLRVLLKNDSLFAWGPEQANAFEDVKKALTSNPVLAYFDPSKSVSLQVDASKSGLGAVLLQDGHPISYVSRSLTVAEQNYPQIDKELLAVVFGCEKFHTYIYGRTVFIQTDHKPLVPIISRPTCMASPRLQRLLLRLQKYPDKVVKHVPGKELHLADTLSRAYLSISREDQDLLDNDKVVMVHYMTVDNDLKAMLRHAYDTDAEVKELRNLLFEGWPNVKRMAPSSCKPYWQVKEQLHEEDGFLYVGERLLIPDGLRRHMLDLIHRGHLGQQKCLERARQSVYWPGLSRDVESHVSQCTICRKFANRQQREPLMPHPVPDLPWQKLAMDILQFKGRDYLVVVDFYSHFPELRLLVKKRAQDVILALKSIFSVHGVPIEVVADNMPFASAEMTKFAEQWGFHVVTSSPHYPRSNGMAERYVQTMKSFMNKAEESGDDVYASLLAYRETALSGLLYSPAEMLFNRQLRTKLPKSLVTLLPKSVHAKDDLQLRQAKQKTCYDRSARELAPLHRGDTVLVRTDHEKTWEPAKIVQNHTNPRSYLLNNGQTLVRRNRVHLQPAGTQLPLVRADGDGETHSTVRNATEGGEKAPVVCSPSRGSVSPEISQVPPLSPADDQQLPRRSLRANRGKLPPRFTDFDMSP